jgi:hypothetical protein
MSCSLSGEALARFAAFSRRARNPASDSPGGSPRRPFRRAASTVCHVSPRTPGIGPERTVG